MLGDVRKEDEEDQEEVEEEEVGERGWRGKASSHKWRKNETDGYVLREGGNGGMEGRAGWREGENAVL